MSGKLIWIFLIILALIYTKAKYELKIISDTKNSKHIMSKSEYRIADYLDRLNVCYKTQYTFPTCKDKRVLPFDFAILNKRGGVVLLIEYDGEQHFKPVRFGGQSAREARKNFRICRLHDKIKNRFCKRKKIPLLRIAYTENKDMYKIIKKKFIELKII